MIWRHAKQTSVASKSIACIALGVFVLICLTRRSTGRYLGGGIISPHFSFVFALSVLLVLGAYMVRVFLVLFVSFVFIGFAFGDWSIVSLASAHETLFCAGSLM